MYKTQNTSFKLRVEALLRNSSYLLCKQLEITPSAVRIMLITMKINKKYIHINTINNNNVVQTVLWSELRRYMYTRTILLCVKVSSISNSITSILILIFVIVVKFIKGLWLATHTRYLWMLGGLSLTWPWPSPVPPTAQLSYVVCFEWLAEKVECYWIDAAIRKLQAVGNCNKIVTNRSFEHYNLSNFYQ